MLFCGTRGTGKTTVAKFCKSRKLRKSHRWSPCGKCQHLSNHLGNSSMNVIEIDAASNNGVDNIRQIREK